MPYSPKLIDQARHHKAWDDNDREIAERSRDAVYATTDRGTQRLVEDEELFWRKVESVCKEDFGRDLVKARAKIVILIGVEKARGRLDHWAYSGNKLMALAQLSEAIKLLEAIARKNLAYWKTQQNVGGRH